VRNWQLESGKMMTCHGLYNIKLKQKGAKVVCCMYTQCDCSYQPRMDALHTMHLNNHLPCDLPYNLSLTYKHDRTTSTTGFLICLIKPINISINKYKYNTIDPQQHRNNTVHLVKYQSRCIRSDILEIVTMNSTAFWYVTVCTVEANT
jgi:hypothetical protein